MSTKRWAAIVLTVALLAASAVGAAKGGTALAAPRTSSLTPPAATPSANVGAFYFDGWGGPVTDYHFDGLEHPGPNGGVPDGQFPDREPLNGWQDNTVETMRTQLAWAHQDGIGFFMFDWYNYPYTAGDPLNGALANYLQLADHNGVGFSLNYVAQSIFAVPLAQLPAIADNWVTQYFLNPDYIRIDGKPLLTITEIRDAISFYGDPNGINQAIDIIQNAAKAHGLPGVYIVGLRQDYQDYCPQTVLDCLVGEDGQQTQQHWDAVSRYGSIGSFAPTVGGPTPYSNLSNADPQFWSEWAQQTSFPYIPSVMTGWDERATNERYHGAFNDPPGNPPDLYWYTRSPSDVGQFLSSAVTAVDQNPQLNVVASPGEAPLVFMEAWNELGEGAYVLPTIGDGNSYGQAIATTLGLPFQTTHARAFTSIQTTPTQATGTLSVTDDWSPCDEDSVQLERLNNATWQTVATAATQPGGSFTVPIPAVAGSYRVSTAESTKYLQTCEATSTTLATLPGAPSSVSAVPGSAPASLTVTYTAPAIDGGSALTGFTATCVSSNGGATQTGTHVGANAVPITITSLSAGKSYTCTIKATNAVGSSLASAASNSVVPGAIGAPSAVKVKSGSTTGKTGSIIVTFALGATNGTTVTRQGATCTAPGGVSVGGTHTGATAAPITVTRATTGKKYTCLVTMTNSLGVQSGGTLSGPVIIGSPSSPTNVKVKRLGSGKLKVTFKAGANNGKPITKFTAACTSSGGGVPRSATHIGATAIAITVTGLTPTKTYTCKVTATNSRGTGQPSATTAATAAITAVQLTRTSFIIRR